MLKNERDPYRLAARVYNLEADEDIFITLGVALMASTVCMLIPTYDRELTINQVDVLTAGAVICYGGTLAVILKRVIRNKITRKDIGGYLPLVKEAVRNHELNLEKIGLNYSPLAKRYLYKDANYFK